MEPTNIVLEQLRAIRADIDAQRADGDARKAVQAQHTDILRHLASAQTEHSELLLRLHNDMSDVKRDVHKIVGALDRTGVILERIDKRLGKLESA